MTIYPYFLEETILASPELTGPLLDVPTRLSDGTLAGGFGADLPALLGARKTAMKDALLCRLQEAEHYTARETGMLMESYHQVMSCIEAFHAGLIQTAQQNQLAVPGVYMTRLEEALGITYEQLCQAAFLREQEESRIIDVAFVLYDGESGDFGQDAVWEQCTLSQAIAGAQHVGGAARMVPVVDGGDLCTYAGERRPLGTHAQFLADPFRYGYALVPDGDDLRVCPVLEGSGACTLG